MVGKATISEFKNLRVIFKLLYLNVVTLDILHGFTIFSLATVKSMEKNCIQKNSSDSVRFFDYEFD